MLRLSACSARSRTLASSSRSSPSAPQRSSSLLFSMSDQLLCAHQFRIGPVLRHQLVVAAQLRDAAVLDDGDAVRIADGGEPVGDDDGGAAVGQLLKGLLELGLR